MPQEINNINSSLNQLSSGRRINSASDDAAGLAIASRQTSQERESVIRADGARDSINQNNTRGAQLGSIRDSLQQARELSVQSQNPLYSGDSGIQAQFNALRDEINAVAERSLGTEEFLGPLDSSDPAASQQALDTALGQVVEQETEIGAQSRGLEAQIGVYETSRVNIAASRSRIEDTDFAATSSNLAQQQTQQEAGLRVQKIDQERKGLLLNLLV